MGDRAAGVLCGEVGVDDLIRYHFLDLIIIQHVVMFPRDSLESRLAFCKVRPNEKLLLVVKFS